MPPSGRLLALSRADRAALERLTRTLAAPGRQRRRARVVLLVADGVTGLEVAQRTGYTPVQVSRIRRRFAEDGLPGLWDRPRVGRPLSIDIDMVPEVVRRALQTPTNVTDFELVTDLALFADASRSAIDRLLRTHGLLPRPGARVRAEPDSRVYEIVGLYLDPPTKVALFSQGSPSGPSSQPRNSALLNLQRTLYWADNWGGAGVPPGSTQASFRTFLRYVVRAQPDVTLHLIPENSTAHKRPESRLLTHSSVVLHPRPKSLPWLTLLDGWMRVLTSQHPVYWTPRAAVEAVIRGIERYLEQWPVHHRPFGWTRKATDLERARADAEVGVATTYAT